MNMNMTILPFLRYSAILFILLTLIINTAPAKPEKVHSITKVIKPYEWYAQQSVEWKSVIDSDPSNREAWLNFYIANKMGKLLNAEEYSKGLGKYFFQLESIVSTAQEKIADSFEAKYMQILNMDSYFDEKQFLVETYDQFPDRYELYDKLTVLYELERNTSKRSDFNMLLYQRDPTISSGILNYNYNVLMSTENNAMLITNGDNDTFPIWMLQDVFGIRTDVAVLNINLLTIDEYRDKIFNELGIDTLKMDWERIAKANDPFAINKTIFSHIAKQSTERPLFIASSVFSANYKHLENNVFMCGLALRFSPNPIDNSSLIIRNFEKRFKLDMLHDNFVRDFSYSVTSTLNYNYLPMLSVLFSHYKVMNDIENIFLIKKIVRNISKDSEKRNDIFKAFDISE
jgi:hypothetical protein